MLFLVHNLPFLDVLLLQPYTLSPIMLKCLIQPIMALFLFPFPFVLLSFACLFQPDYLYLQLNGCSYGSPVLSDDYSRMFI